MPTWDVQHAHIGGFFSFGTKISRKLRRLTIDDDNLIILSSKKTTNVSKHVSTAQNLQFVEEPGVLVVSTSYCLHVCGFGTGARRLYFSSQESLTSFTDAIMSLKASSNTRLQEQDIQDDVFIVQLLGVTGLKSSDDPYLKATSPVNDSKVFAKTENHLNKASPIFTIKDKNLFVLKTSDLSIVLEHGLKIAVWDSELATKDKLLASTVVSFEDLMANTGTRRVFRMEVGGEEDESKFKVDGGNLKNLAKSVRDVSPKKLVKGAAGASSLVAGKVKSGITTAAHTTQHLLQHKKKGCLMVDHGINLAIKVTKANENDELLVAELFSNEENKVDSKMVIVSSAPDLATAELPSSTFHDLTAARTLTTATNTLKVFGKLFIEIISCKGLDNKDFSLFGGKTDAFACIAYGKRVAYTDVVANSLDPFFPPSSKRAFTFPLQGANTAMHVAIFDYDVGSAHDYIGRCSLNLGQLDVERDTPNLLKFQLFIGGADTKPTGEVTLRIQLIPESSIASDIVSGSLGNVVELAKYNTAYALFGDRTTLANPVQILRLHTKRQHNTAFIAMHGVDPATAKHFSNSDFFSLVEEARLTLSSGAEMATSAMLATVLWKPGSKKYSFILLLSTLVALQRPADWLVSLLLLYVFLALLAINHASALAGEAISFQSGFVMLTTGRPATRSKRTANFSLERLKEEEAKKFMLAEAKTAKILKATEYWLEQVDNIGSVPQNGPQQRKKVTLNPLAILLGSFFPRLQNLVKMIRVGKNIILGHDAVFNFLLTSFFGIASVAMLILPIYAVVLWSLRLLVVLILGPQNIILRKRYIESGRFERLFNYNIYGIVEEGDVELQHEYDEFILNCKVMVREKMEARSNDAELSKLLDGKHPVEINVFNELRVQSFPLE